MKKLNVYLIGQKYEIELEEEFYEYVKNDIDKISKSDTQIRDLLNLVLSLEYKQYINEQKMKKLIKKLEK